MHLDLGPARREILLDPPILAAGALVPLPLARAWYAKRGMHHHDDELPAGTESCTATLPHRRQRRDVLDREDHDRRVERLVADDLAEAPGVSQSVFDRQPFGAVSPLRRFEERRRRVDSEGADPRTRERPAEDALSARDVEHALPPLGLEQAERPRDDDALVILAAAFADELVVPVGDVMPAALSGRFAAAAALSQTDVHAETADRSNGAILQGSVLASLQRTGLK